MIDSKFWMRVKAWDYTGERSLFIQETDGYDEEDLEDSPEGNMKRLGSRVHEWYMGIGDDDFFKRLKVKRAL